jgi:hypothetical protein
MKVRMLVDISGTLNGRPYPRKGEVGDFVGPVAEHLVSNRYAEFVDPPKKTEVRKDDNVETVEVASVDPVVEKAAKVAPRPRKPAES